MQNIFDAFSPCIVGSVYQQQTYYFTLIYVGLNVSLHSKEGKDEWRTDKGQIANTDTKSRARAKPEIHMNSAAPFSWV